MTFNQTSSIRFSVEESVWFKKGQEVSDLLAMSLDPEISVQEHEDYITIRGALVLTGDYYPFVGDQVDDQEIHSLRDTATLRTVDEVIENDAGIHSMRHRFPVDITIPTNRISNLEDVYVLVEAFDYEIPERGRLELKADLAISGIVNERTKSILSVQDSEATETIQEEVITEEDPNGSFQQTLANIESARESIEKEDEEVEDKFPSFFTEVRKETEEENYEEFFEEENKDYEENNEEYVNVMDVEKNDFANELVAFSRGSEKSLETEMELGMEIEQIQEQVLDRAPELALGTEIENEIEQEIKSEIESGVRSESQIEPEIEQEIDEVIEQETEEEMEQETEHNTLVNIFSKQISPQVEMKGRADNKEQFWTTRSLYTSSKKTNSEDLERQVESTQRSNRSENALYLTKMLSSLGEDDFSKLRIRIVQSGETLSTIAKNYEISATQIIRLNRLNDDVLKEGQILYIPEYAGVE